MKKVLLTALILILAGFFAGVSAQQLVTGTFSVDYTAQGYTLDKNSGERVFSKYVTFENGFEKAPTIILNVTKLDAAKDTNVRYEVTSEAVSRDGFTIKIKTWNDTKIFAVGGNWIAVPAQ
jgi:carbonic anhydrase